MIQELVELGKRVTAGKSRALKEEFYSIVIAINELGEFQRFIVGEKQPIDAEVLTSKKGKARFLLDKSEEVLGVGDGDVDKKHQLFMEKLELYKDVPMLKPVFRFYDKENENGLRKAIEEYGKLKIKTTNEVLNLTFMVGTTTLLKTEEIKEAIQKHFAEGEKQLANGRFCSICGTDNSPVLDEPHGPVKNMPKPKKDTISNKALVSFNETAFESYGLKGNLNSSICRNCARNYIEGLNFLLSDGNEVPKTDKRKAYYKYNHRINLSDSTAILFWTRQETADFDPFVVFDTPDVSEIKNLFDSVWDGKQSLGAVVDTNMFYSCTLSSVAARIAVRDWIAISLDDYKRNLAEWFRDIEIVNRDGDFCYSPLKVLINATQKDLKPGEKPPQNDPDSKTRIGGLLWNAAIKGRSHMIPIEVLQYVLARIWKGDTFSVSRAAIIKLIIKRNTNKNMKSTLDEGNTSVAYLCGRLFAVIESMQWKAMGNVNSGVKERFFAAAASQPAFVFGTLLTKNVTIYQRKIGGYLANDLKEIAGKISEMGSFPLRFSTIEQGEFALGYYFQKNHKKDNETSEDINS